MKVAKVYMHDTWAGVLTEDEDGYHFQYEESYLKKPDSEAISVTFPLAPDQYDSKVLFPFFDGLIPEGWLLDIAQKNWKLNPRDRMSILLKTCYDCIGAVSIRSQEENGK
ncbi:HipA N-terminal domain-containing protein [Tunicatimonas pelagia]|uniref:HipA N-terminal domain-containing protein n=1 Tax=Tunicatimonas pelagia TaxID=931531 RepID=UPI002666FB55|nr:HipA N-terminal domain-containing protein [Tunicatimonas pelagia]WKN45653.1 HipA N-terminal domain-containing protein [Tunicatimonas pelagia]